MALGANCFLLYSIASIYSEGSAKLPESRSRLLAVFANRLLWRELNRHDKDEWPRIDELRNALGDLAFSMQDAGKHGTSVSNLWVREQLQGINCGVDEFLYYGASATLLDTSDGQVRFVHQLLQEYFAAVALQARLTTGDNLRRYWQDGWLRSTGWEEPTVLLAGMLPDMTVFIEQLLPFNPPLAARCIIESGGERPAPWVSIHIQGILVVIATSLTAPIKERNAAGNALNILGDPRPGVGVVNGLPEIIWCEVPAGEVLMGAIQETDDMAVDNESPQHRVLVPSFSISKYLITNAQFQAFVDDGGYTEKSRRCWTKEGWEWKKDRIGPERSGGDFDLFNHPAINISWYEALAFCNWLGAKLGYAIGLPTEAQWERAARGADGRQYPWGSKISTEHANFGYTGIDTTSAVGIFPKGASPFGLLEASGNAWEWTAAKWADYHEYKPTDQMDGDELRVLRGGSYFSQPQALRCAYRNTGDPHSRRDTCGFRVVRCEAI